MSGQEAPETEAPETGAPETGAPETGAPETGPPLGLDAGARRVLTLLCLAFAVLHLLFLAALLLVPGGLDRRSLAAAVLVLLACCAASLERLATAHPRAALALAALPTAACLLFDAYAFAGGPR